MHGAQYEQALRSHPGEPARLVEAFLAVTLRRIADPVLDPGGDDFAIVTP
ncbi:hypothetical protein ACFVAG_32715 [Streptomyces sp. NPDC057644]